MSPMLVAIRHEDEDYDAVDEPSGATVVSGFNPFGSGKQIQTLNSDESRTKGVAFFPTGDNEDAEENDDMEQLDSERQREQSIELSTKTIERPPEWSDDNKEVFYDYVMKVFPEFAPNKVLRFSRLFGPGKSALPHMSRPSGARKRDRLSKEEDQMEWEEIRAKKLTRDMYESGDEVRLEGNRIC